MKQKQFNNEISLIDTHCHYNSVSLSNLEEKIDYVNNDLVLSKVINIGLDYSTSKEVVRISNQYYKFYATIGIHPLFDGNISDLENLYFEYDNKKIVGIGEVGIDTTGNIDIQIKRFIESINLANELKLPLIIHSNTTKNANIYANLVCLEIIKKYTPKYGFLFHFFQPDLNILSEIVELGGYISVGSNILKPNAKKSLEVVRNIDINRLLIETDYPYLANKHGITLLETFDKVCMLREIDKNQMIKTLNDNTKRLFYKINN